MHADYYIYKWGCFKKYSYKIALRIQSIHKIMEV